MTTEQRRDFILQTLDTLKKELSFLNDSEDFYPLELGIGTRSVMVMDFSEEAGRKVINTDNQRKITENWYKNYAGFLTTEESEFNQVFRRVRSFLKLKRIHKTIETTDFPNQLTVGQSSLTNWFTISYNNTGDINSDPQTAFVPLAVPTTTIVSTNKPGSQTGVVYFSSLSNCQAAINGMIDNEMDDKKYDDLKYLLNLISIPSSSVY